MIQVRGLTKRYGDKIAVDDITFDVLPGRVTGFLGPNGAGKSTTMRAIVGLDRPTAGTVTIDGKSYADLDAPLTKVGALLEARATHPGRSAANHLAFLAAASGIRRSRVDEVLALVGLTEVAGNRANGYSLGMGQRLGIAAALLGNAPTLLFDEPVNGLDPEGIIWVRNLLKGLAQEGRTVLISSHLMAEMALTADHLIVIGRGRLIADTTVENFVTTAGTDDVLVRTPDTGELRRALIARGASITDEPDGALVVRRMHVEEVGRLAAETRTVLYELTPRRASLEEAFMELTKDSLEYTGGVTAAAGTAVAS
ncbi:MAG: type transport system ATP-binding protein [Frankiaceae bacterium]|jgi:ABC-2 type transport system ATP-binding protein|nr:type transport system ATP-binding protein [Frankiaceae bacterium]MDQ1727595.1 type transport system ATP-binding protein [Frankiaceae bacterium]